MNRHEENFFSCSMCYYLCASNNQLMIHVVRHHKNDPKFKIQCTQRGCGSTYTKWKSFRQHLYRNHQLNVKDNINELINTGDEDYNNVPLEENNEILDNDIEDDMEIDGGEDIVVDRNECLEWYAAQFIINIRENCNISSNAIEHIIDGVTNLVDVYTSILLKRIKEKQNIITNDVKFEDIVSIFKEEYPSNAIFSSVQTKDKLDRVLIEKFKMVPSVNVIVGKGLKWKKKKNARPRICNITYDAQVVSVLDNLKNLLMNKEVRSSLSRRSNHDQVMRTVLDGSYYRQNPYFLNNTDALAIILYYDDVGMANPLGGNSKIHKQSMFYWTLANLDPKVRSSLDTIQLYAIVKTEYLKKPGVLDKLLQPFIDDIKILQTERIEIDIGRGRSKTYKGSLLFCAGDTPALAVLGGFKESTASYRLCRSCTATHESWKLQFRDQYFIQRNITSHQDIVNIINDETITPAAKAFWQKYYDINNRSPLMDIEYFDITTCFPQDAMHVLIEGPLEIVIRVYLTYCIKIRQLFTLDVLNEKLSNFDYKHFKKDKPAPIESHHLELTGTLRQSAAQLLTLAHTLPFILSEWIIPSDDPDLNERNCCYIRILQIVNLYLAYEIRVISIDFLALMIESFILIFKDLYPDCIVPKFHYLIHIPRYIKLFGPARQQWCFRFEGTHTYFKSLMSVVRSFKNVPITLAYRHQARLCSKLSSFPGMPCKKFLYQGDTVTPGKIVPFFGVIDEIFIWNDKKLLLLSLLSTQMYEAKLNAYHVIKSVNNQKSVIDIADLIFPHDLSSFHVMNKTYVPLVYHERVEFYG